MEERDGEMLDIHQKNFHDDFAEALTALLDALKSSAAVRHLLHRQSFTRNKTEISIKKL